MPELPEVEVLRRQLEREYMGKRIKSAELKSRKFVKKVKPGPRKVVKDDFTPKDFERHLVGAKVKVLSRRGKFLIFELDTKEFLVFHLGMSGHLVRATPKRPPDKHTHVVLAFTGAPELRYFDARRFGECFIAGQEEFEQALGHLGLDAINDPIPWQQFGEMVSNRNVKMKSLLMDQEFIAGLGNIYSDEVLFQAGLPWDRPSSTLTSNETRRLSRAVGEILQDAIKHRGTTLSDGEWRDLYDIAGEHQDHLAVVGRDGLPCRRCRTPVKRLRVSNRSHFYCPQCQSNHQPPAQ
ncbi:MAG TPA: bifunctional DNA-formamidopyrimidine glycosylase/DNA-(apurinic or apyrimidinic site) lyase [Actinomycetota bacterium]|nr:bifunctional DNA-formamidopyrimidine glycosylase/DNA-(apurinic or apyrimidinic site) lyase [Actinomycetota bacterium]